MHKILTVFVFVLSGLFVQAQTFNGTGGAVPGSSTVQTCFPLPVSGVGAINDVSNGLSGVCINMTHPNTDELEIVLKAPDGTVVPLTIQNGGDGNNYTNTCFSATATSSIKFANAPFTGTFEPEGYLGAVNNGQNANGTWQLCVQDRRTSSNAGTLNNWSITFSNTPAPQPPAFPVCTNTLPAASSCANATAVCDFNGLCGNTSGSSVQDWVGSGLNSCFGLQNNSFIKFIAAANTASFTVWVPTNNGGTTGGIQMLFFGGTCNAGPVTTHGCYPHIFPYQSSSNPVATIITANGLTPGNTYYLMFDGFNNDIATFRIAAKSGVNFLNINPGAPSICNGQSINLTASGSDGTYSWSPSGGLNTTAGANVSANPTTTATYTVSSTTSTGCNLTKDVTVTVNNLPAITTQPSTTVQNICQNKPVTALNIVANAGSGTISSYQWYVTTSNNNTSGAPIPFATLSSYTPSSANVGTVYFYCRVTNSNGCTITSNVSGALIVSALVATPTASATVQPTCAAPTGTIAVTLPAGANIQYSVDGVNYQTSGTFSGLAPGITYNVTAKNISTGCVSAARAVMVNPPPAGPAVSASITLQPTCVLPTGVITVSSPTGADYEYSVDGIIYQPTLIFSGLTNSTTYTVTLRQISTGCISPILPLTINAIAGAPAKPDATVTHPDCNIANGTITVTAPLNANYEYSVGGAYQAGLSFNGLTPGNNYPVTVKDITTGCVSVPLDTAINIFVPIASPAVISPVTYCQNAPSVALTAAGSNLKWYAGLTTPTVLPSAPLPSTATAGSIKYYVSQTVAGCEGTRDSITVTVSPTPSLPVTAGNTTTYCENGNASVLTATGSNLQWYDIANGGSPLPGAPIPNTSSPGNPTYYVTQTADGCESGRAAIAITVNATPASPGIANPNIQYCQNTTATTLTATGSNLRWYDINGTQYVSAPVPSTANTGSTLYFVSQTVNGCESGRDIITVTVVAVATPPVTAPVNYCLNQTPSALTAVGIGLKWYSTLTSTTALPSAPMPVTTTIGSTKYYVSQLINGCESRKDSIEVTVKPTSAAPGVISPLEFCQNTTAPALTATGNNLLWYADANGGTGSTTAPTPQTAVTRTNFYYVTQNNNGCESNPRTAITVTINVTSTAVAGFHYSSDTYCLNAVTAPSPSYDLGFTQGGTFTSRPAGLNINATTGDITLPSSSTGTYDVTYTYNTNGCINGNASSTTITLNPPIPTELRFSYSSPVCKDAAPVVPQTFANFTTGGTFTSIPTTGLSINAAGVVDVSNSQPGFYTVIYSVAEQGCRNADSRRAAITIVDTSSPVTKFDYSSTDICLTSGATSPTITKANGFITGGVFTATPAGLNINSGTGDINIGLSIPGTYTIKYSVPALGCRLAGSDSLILKLKTYGNPVVGFSYVGPVCEGGNNAIPVPDANFTDGGTYSALTAGLEVDAISGMINLSQSIPGSHSIKYEVAQGICNPVGSSTAAITVLAQPQAPTVTSAGICGEGSIVLNASSSGIISWYTEAALLNQVYIGSSFSTFITGTTKYYVTNTVGTCESKPAIANAIVNPVPAKPFLGGDTSICPNEKLILKAGTYNSYLWQDGSTNSTYTVAAQGNYKVIVSTGPGCSDSADINITILEDCNDIIFPSAFAPNGLNKTFGALGNMVPVSKYLLRIFNRYGQEIFATSDPLKKWEGTYQGKPVNIGAYVYIATYVYKNRINKVKKGTVTVVR